jgi:hypothetical protein
MMGHWIVRISLLLNVTLFISIISIFYPKELQATATTIFFFEKDPTLALWSFYGLVVGGVTLLAILAIRDIGNRRMEAAGL